MSQNIVSRMYCMEERMRELDQGFARIILDLERRVRALSESGDMVPSRDPSSFAAPALASITIPGPQAVSCLPREADSAPAQAEFPAEASPACNRLLAVSCEVDFTDVLQSSALAVTGVHFSPDQAPAAI
ncbi:MAG: hypothetical protein LBG06_07330 [Deltaproteobacteria bacterium]|jgi:hypothetical protein|nr:hypothetical protein [Deltaproteobacteria bacterium]